MMAAPTAGLSRLAELLSLGSGTWAVLLHDGPDLDELAHEAMLEVAWQFEEDGLSGSVLTCSSNEDDALARLGAVPSSAVVWIIHGRAPRLVALLYAMDRERTRFLGGLRFLIITDTISWLLGSAETSNLRSLIGGNVFEFDPSLGVLDAEERLRSLREDHQASDNEIIRQAEAGERIDPEKAEWLALLGRSDLLAH